ncbi:hypothetical protein MX850_08770 [Erysipelothrix sp. Poltava]|nr:hypothetical protein MX850_08770 [Erysipelothrix sp. Poltava]
MKKNKVVMVFFDILVLILSIIGGLAILNNSHYAMELLYQRIGLFEVGLILVMYLIFYKIFSLDKMIWRKISVHETIRIGLGNIMAFLSCMVIIIIRNDEFHWNACYDCDYGIECTLATRSTFCCSLLLRQKRTRSRKR